MKKLTAIAGTLMLASGMAMAVDEPGTGQDFADVDRNQDGVITQSEASADPGLLATFIDADLNADGYLTPSEFAATSGETEAKLASD